MDLGNLIERAWRLTWRYHFLWVLGLFVPGGGSCSLPGRDLLFEQVPPTVRPEGITPGFEDLFVQIGGWVAQNVGVSLTLVAVVGLLALLFLMLWFIAHGGMAWATVALAQGQSVTFGDAWRTGLRLVWRYVGLFLLQMGLTLAALAVGGALIGLFVAVAATVGDAARLLMTLSGVLLGLGAVVAIAGFLIALSIAVAFAQRAMVVEDVGPVTALRAGAALVQFDLAYSVVVWLIHLALNIALAIAVALAVVIVLLPFSALGFILILVLGVSPTSVSYAVAAGFIGVATAWFLGGIASAFSWNYWTLTYLALTGRLTARLQPLPVPSG